MKKQLAGAFVGAAFAGAVLSGPAVAGQGGSGEIRVAVHGIQPGKGNVRMVLFREAAGFPVDMAQGWQRVGVPVSGETAEAGFTGVPAGTYAVAVMQDENGNGKLDRSLVGKPVEPWGVSNNLRFAFRAPRFDEAKFAFNGTRTTIEIKLAK